MNIVCVTAYTAGIVHTHTARERLIKRAKALGHTVRVETQGTISIENELQVADIFTVDVMILAINARIKGEECFTNKCIVQVKTEIVTKLPVQFLEKVEKSLGNK